MRNINRFWWYGLRVNAVTLVAFFFMAVLLLVPETLVVANASTKLVEVHMTYFYVRGWLLFVYLCVGVWAWLTDHHWKVIQWALLLIALVTLGVDIPIVYGRWIGGGSALFWILVALRVMGIACLVWNVVDEKAMPPQSQRSILGLKARWMSSSNDWD